MAAAAKLFSRHGYRGAPLAAIANAVDMTQPGLLHHFRSKEHLLMAVLEERDRENRERIRALWGDRGRPHLATLQALVDHNMQARDLVQMFMVLASESVAPDHPAHQFFVDRYAALRQELSTTVRLDQPSGPVRPDIDPTTVATLILAVMDGLQLQWLLDEQVDMRPGFALFLDLLLRHLRDPPGDPAPTP